jgi:predicted ATP-dependent endonuclease of OLD family
VSYPAYAAKLGIDLDRSGATIVEVGGKRNLKDLAELAVSFCIPTGVVYDQDSSDFQGQRDKEAEYNATLDKLACDDPEVKVWRMEKKHEDVVRNYVGEAKYQTLCGRYPQVSNATRQRLIAADAEMTVPPKFEELLRWLASPTASTRLPAKDK